MFRVAAATALYCAVHSALASAPAKELAVRAFGDGAHALYRPFFLAQSLALMALLALYALRQPDRDLYLAKGPLWWAMRAGQVVCLLLIALSVYHAGADFLAGWPSLSAWASGAEVPAMPDGQGPRPLAEGTMLATGPFAYTRQPLNWLIIPLFWLNPRMTARLLAVFVVSTVYLVLGSLHAEQHLVAFYGEAYRLYQERVPFAPGLPRG